MQLITAAFLPLLDASILIAAREKGFAEAEGIDLILAREVSWANVRDRMAIGHFDAAHMLAPMPVAANLGLTPFADSIIAPLALGLGGNAITLSKALYERLGSPRISDSAKVAGLALRGEIDHRTKSGEEMVRFGVVHPHSSHFLELRYWLSACGIDPENEVDTIILPPQFLPDALAQGTIDGFCVGEPYNSIALHQGSGVLAISKHAIWRNSPEKVLGVRGQWALRHKPELQALVRALYKSALWCGKVEHRSELSQILARPDYLDRKASLIESALCGPAGFEPHANAATFPWQSHALWFYSQMVRWGQVTHSPENVAKARTSYRPDIYREALADENVPVPSASSKVEGALTMSTPVGAGTRQLNLGPDGFFDGRIFDPDAIDSYIFEQTPLAK